MLRCSDFIDLRFNLAKALPTSAVSSVEESNEIVYDGENVPVMARGMYRSRTTRHKRVEE